MKLVSNLKFPDGTIQTTAGGYVRTTTTHTSGSIASGITDNSTLTVAPGWRAFNATTDRAARIRIYDTSAHRTADASRAVGTDPTGNHGLLFELVTTVGQLSYTLTPAVDFASSDGSSTYYVAVTNLSGLTATVTTTYSYIRTE